MSRNVFRAMVLAAICLSTAACATGAAAPAARPDAAALAAHRAWWQAYASGDLATLEARTAADAEAVFSSGVRLPRTAVIAAAGNNRQDSGFTMEWSDESVRFPRAGLAIVSGTSTEAAGSSQQVFRMTAVLEQTGRDDWKLLAVQSTRLARFAPAVPANVSGPIDDYAGAYATPRGRLITMQARDGDLWMVEPDGKATKLTPTGPGLFEPTGLSPLNGVLRLVFARDASGRVDSFSRLADGRVDTFRRAR